MQSGVQAEVLLRATQANHSAFAFLDAAHPLHSYFTHLKHTRQQHEEVAVHDTTADTADARGEGERRTALEQTAAGAAAAPQASAESDLHAVGVAPGAPPGIRRKPISAEASDSNVIVAADSVSGTERISAEEPGQVQQQPAALSVVTAEAGTKTNARSSEDLVAQQLQAAKERLLAMVAQRTAT